MMSAALPSCTKAVGVEVAFDSALPVLTFHTEGFLPHPLNSVCLWDAAIIDEGSGRTVTRLRPVDYQNDCARVSGVSFRKPERVLAWAFAPHPLIRGHSYHAEVMTEDAGGKSKPWRQQ